MRCVLLADTHLFTDDLPELPDADILIHAGDACRGGDLDELREAADYLKKQKQKYKILVAGNHEKCLEEEPAKAVEVLGSDIIYLQDQSIFIDGVHIYGSPWTPTYANWAFMRRRGAELAEKWAQIPHGVDLLVTHGPPLGFGDGSDEPDRQSYHGYGCADLRARVLDVRPLLHVFGHMHMFRGVWISHGVTFINTTTWECEKPPTVVDIDVKKRIVRVVSM